MGFLTRCKRPFLFAFLLQFCNMLFSFFLKTFLILFEKQHPEWMAGLEDEDVAFIKKFLLASGSLKEVAGLYGVTYPTVRLRLDRLIQKIHLSEDTAADPYVALVKRLAVADKLDFDTAKLLIQSYKKTKGEDA